MAYPRFCWSGWAAMILLALTASLVAGDGREMAAARCLCAAMAADVRRAATMVTILIAPW